ncbi:MAG TPA: PUA domain-containing protein [Candidatus Thermoplasmatota archaeon]|nr:PUA domain-containing protein [Candidatus Thermoplasmatota archaeon]
MTDLRLRHRARMREKDAARLAQSLADAFGIPDPFPPTTERADAGEHDVLIAGGRIVAFIQREPERIAPTCRLLMQRKPTKRYVTVDMGAIKFVNNGADIMAPGITEADPGIMPGDFVWVRDEKNKVPLAVGEALVPGAQMPRGPKGKAIKNLHRVGDEMWNLDLTA